MIRIPKKEPLNIVPFIDIMLVLLAMVLSVSTFIARGEIPVQLPKAESAAAPGKTAEPRRVQVDAAGSVFFEGEQLDLAALGTRIRALGAQERVLLSIDKTVPFERFIAVVDVLKKEKHENFSIEAERGG